jgi:hypothetical protein
LFKQFLKFYFAGRTNMNYATLCHIFIELSFKVCTQFQKEEVYKPKFIPRFFMTLVPGETIDRLAATSWCLFSPEHIN